MMLVSCVTRSANDSLVDSMCARTPGRAGDVVEVGVAISDIYPPSHALHSSNRDDAGRDANVTVIHQNACSMCMQFYIQISAK